MVTKRSTGSKAEGFRTRFANYLNEFGTNITLYKKVEIKDSMGRLTDSSETSSTILCDIQYVNKRDIMHLNLGDVQIGDGMLFTKNNVTINIHDEVELTSDGVRWKITSQMEGELVKGEQVYQGFIIRKND